MSGQGLITRDVILRAVRREQSRAPIRFEFSSSTPTSLEAKPSSRAHPKVVFAYAAEDEDLDLLQKMADAFKFPVGKILFFAMGRSESKPAQTELLVSFGVTLDSSWVETSAWIQAESLKTLQSSAEQKKILWGQFKNWLKSRG
jgi:hypothetical protein